MVDDLIAYLHADDHVFLIPNAANTAEVVRRLRAAAPAGSTVTDEHEEYAVLAVQGPRSAEVLAALGLPTEHDYMSFAVAGLRRRGRADRVPHRLHRRARLRAGRAGRRRGRGLGRAGRRRRRRTTCAPAGLAARDTLRTEMGYPLHGQDLSLEITPVQARSGWAVGWSKPAFWGRDALLAERAAGPRRLLWGLEALDRGIPRAHMTVLRDGTPVGEVTSGTFSPTRRVGIALALLDTAAGLADGDEVEVDVRGRRSAMRVVKPPFVKSSVR